MNWRRTKVTIISSDHISTHPAGSRFKIVFAPRPKKQGMPALRLVERELPQRTGDLLQLIAGVAHR